MEVDTHTNENHHKKQKTLKTANGSAINTPSKQNSSVTTNSDALALKIHHCKFFDWMPSMISSMAFSTNNRYLAVGYSNGNIEIRTQQNNWFVERVIPGLENLSIRTLCWSGERLFSCSLTGKIAEWDIQTLKLKHIEDSFGGAVYSIASCDKQDNYIAAACNDGTLKLFDISDGQLKYHRTFSKTEKGPVISVAWHPSGESIFTGGADSTIRRWELKSGICSTVMKTQFKVDVIIWSLAVFSDNTVISGDSIGNTQFWDGDMGIMISSYKQHEADVLAVTANESLGIAFSSGIDSQVSLFTLVTENEVKRWVCSTSQRLTSHDVKTLVMNDEYVLSGGNECRVALYPISEFRDRSSLIKLTAYPHHSLVSFSASQRLLLFQHEKKLSLWRLGEAAKNEKISDCFNGQVLSVKDDSALLLNVQLKTAAIATSALSPDASYIAASDSKGLRLFKLNYDDKVQAQKLASVLPKGVTANRLCFTNDSLRLIVAGNNHTIYIINMESNTVEHVFGEHGIVDPERRLYPAPIATLAVSTNNKWLASGDTNNMIHIFDLENLTYHSSLPKFASLHVAFTFSPHDENILGVVCSNNLFFFYDVTKKQLNDWSRDTSNSFSQEYMETMSRITGMKFHPTKNMVILYSDRVLFFVNLEKTEFKQVVDYRCCMFVDFSEEGDVVLVDRPWRHIIANLPEPLYRVRYGI